MKNIIILPLSVYLENNINRSINAFVDMGISRFWILLYWFKLNSIFNQYRKGVLSTEEFRVEIGKLFPKAVSNQEKFDAAWNESCRINENTVSLFDQIETLKDDYRIFLLSSTNPLHIKNIEKLTQTIPGEHFWSYDHQKLGADLLKALIQSIQKEYKGDEKQPTISLFYQPPGDKPYANWGGLGWIFAPFQRWAHLQKENYCHSLLKVIKDEPSIQLVEDQHLERQSLSDLLEAKNKATFEPEQGIAPIIHSRRKSKSPDQDKAQTSYRQRTDIFSKGRMSY